MHGLGAEVAEARWMVRIPLDALHDAAVHLHQQAASHPAVRAEGAPPRALLAAPDSDHASCHRRPRVGAVACPRSVGSRRAPGCASNARATGTPVWLHTQARIESGSTALPTSRAALQTSRSRGELPAQWADRLRDRLAQTQNYSPTRIQAHFVSSFSSARDRPEGGTLDGDALCIAWERSTPDGTHVAAPDPDDEQDRGAQVGEGWAGDHRRPRPLRPRGVEDHRRG